MSLDELLDALTERPIAFSRGFVKLTGSINAALMLSQAMYWRKKTKDENGWFYKSRDEWEEETGMTRREQESARKKLLDSGLWEEWRDRINHRIYFRVKMDAFRVMAESALTHGTKAPLPNGGKRPSSNVSETTPKITDEKVRDEKMRFQSPTLKTSPQKPTKHGAAPLPELPEEMAALKPDWERWQEYLREKRKPLTPIQAHEQIALMLDMTDAEVREAMKTAMRAGWPSFYAPKKAPESKPANAPAECRL